MEDWLAASARRRPAHPALITTDGAVRYAELDHATDLTARRLAASGVGPGSRVVTTLPAGRAFAQVLHALPRLGAVLVPLDPRGRRPGGDHVIDEPPTGAGTEVSLKARIDPDAVHSVIHTSGTTGQPKAVELSFRNHHSSALASAEALGVDSGDRWLCPLPVFHVGGLAIPLRTAIYGATAILHERFEVDAVNASIESGEATLVSLVPTMLHRLREAGLRPAPTLKAIVLGGGPAQGELLAWGEDAGIPVVPVYGMTETATHVAAGIPGTPLRDAELQIGEQGEILVRGPMVSRGALAADGWLHTGDLGRLDNDGRLHVLGRLKELIVSGGENVAPAEVEEALLSHPAVVDAGVVGLPDPDWGEAVTAFVVLREPADEAELIEHLRPRLASFKLPKRIEQVAGLPRNPAGKLLRGEIVP